MFNIDGKETKPLTSVTFFILETDSRLSFGKYISVICNNAEKQLNASNHLNLF